MKSIIFDLSVSRQHGELLQGLQAADMFLSYCFFESIETYRRGVAHWFLFSLHQAMGGGDANPQFIDIYMSIALYILKNRGSYWI